MVLRFGPERFAALTFAFTEVPAIDVVMISHAHCEHLSDWLSRALAQL